MLRSSWPGSMASIPSRTRCGWIIWGEETARRSSIPRRKASKPTFVELTEPHVVPLAEYAVDFECPSGRKMRIQWKASGPPDWVSLLRAWGETEG